VCDLQAVERISDATAHACPSCRGVACRTLFESHGFPILHCDGCGHRFTPLTDIEAHVATVYGDAYFTEGGAGYTDYLAEGTMLTETGRRYGEILKRFAAPGRVLDVGSAAGFILKGLSEAGFRGRGLEPNDRMARHAREVVGVNVEVGTLENAVVDEPVDVVTMVQVVGHFFDLERAFAAAARATRDGGLWLIEAWDYGSLPARVLGRRWHEYSPPSVVHWFTRHSLAKTVSRWGFREIGYGRPRKRIAVSHAKSLIAYKAPRLAALVPALDVTLPYPAFDVFYGVYQKVGAPAGA
jgi:SAM-dependent methyltransferase